MGQCYIKVFQLWSSKRESTALRKWSRLCDVQFRLSARDAKGVTGKSFVVSFSNKVKEAEVYVLLGSDSQVENIQVVVIAERKNAPKIGTDSIGRMPVVQIKVIALDATKDHQDAPRNLDDDANLKYPIQVSDDGN